MAPGRPTANGPGWGRSYLVSPPDYFTVAYEINPYMHLQVIPDHELAMEEHQTMVSLLRRAGASVERLEPVDGLPDLVFTANAGLVDRAGGASRFIPSRFRHPERQAETPYDIAWFSARGFDIDHLPPEEPFEGAGDALPFEPEGASSPVLLCGYRTRSSITAHRALSDLLGLPVRSLELVDDRYYHLDLVFCPLDGRRAIVAPQGLDRYGCRVIEELVPEPIWLEDDEAASFSANAVVVGTTVLIPSCSPRLGRLLERAGLEVVPCPVGEFQKAGGGVRCLTLALDMELAGSRRPLYDTSGTSQLSSEQGCVPPR